MRPVSCQSCKTLCSPNQPDSGRFLLHRIHGSGMLHRRSFRFSLSFDQIPCQYQPPFTLISVSTSGAPTWQTQNSCDGHVLRYLVRIPLTLTLCTLCGEQFCVSSCIEEVLPIRLHCPVSETWRYQVHVNAAVRLVCSGQYCNGCSCCPLLEVLIEGFLLSPCQMAGACPLPCPETKPWYPSPGCC